jgi:hypothetical protein
MRSVSKPNGPFEIVEREIPDAGVAQVRIKGYIAEIYPFKVYYQGCYYFSILRTDIS